MRSASQGAGLYPFVPTEAGPLEFNTGIATADGPAPDWQYRYDVLRLGRFVPGAGGSFRTCRRRRPMTNLLFCAISCSSAEEDGSWEPFRQFVEDSLPQFVLMMGDQVYLDDDDPDVFDGHFESTSPVRRRAMAEKYRLNWSREPVRRVLANVPTYMIWDDHDIRDGWGSSAPATARRCSRSTRAARRSSAS